MFFYSLGIIKSSLLHSSLEGFITTFDSRSRAVKAKYPLPTMFDSPDSQINDPVFDKYPEDPENGSSTDTGSIPNSDLSHQTAPQAGR